LPSCSARPVPTLQSIGFRWLSGVEAKGTRVGGRFASTPLSERLTQWPESARQHSVASANISSRRAIPAKSRLKAVLRTTLPVR